MIGDHRVTFWGRRFRVCVYPTAGGFSSFVEDRFYRGGTGEHPSPRSAWLAGLALVASTEHHP